MHRPVRICLLALIGVTLVCGCALRSPRDSYAYGRMADGLWDAEYDLLIDWNFPTSANQGPLVAPQRFRPERPAIGVPWATGNPMHPRPEQGQAPALEAGPADTAMSAHDADDAVAADDAPAVVAGGGVAPRAVAGDAGRSN